MRIFLLMTILFGWLGNWSSPPIPAMDEICNNGIDDDGDGQIDCLDGDCIYSGFCEPCAQDLPTPQDIQTGFDEGTGLLLPAGSLDSSWTWSTTLSGAEEYAFTGTCACDPAGAWVCTPVPLADWISSSANCLGQGESTTYYHYRFNLDPALATFLQLNLVLYADDYVQEVYLNNGALGVSSNPPNYLAGTGRNFSITTGFAGGTNRLSLAVRNTGGPGGLLLTADPSFDFDDDGVPDDQDRCLLSPAGFPVDAYGCTYFLTEQDAELCTGSSFVWGNQEIAAPGLYTDTLVSSLGCDSVLQLLVREVQEQLIFFDSTICQGNVVQIGSQPYTQSGSYLDTLQTTQGCDSIISLNLTVLPFFDVEIDTAVVVCEEAFVAGTPIFGDTVLVENLLASTGCDSTVRYVITAIEKPQTNFASVLPFCEGDSLSLQADALPGASYQWSTGASSPEIRVRSGGMYVLTTEVQFCQWTDSVFVPEPIDLQLNYDFSPLICAGTQAGFLTILEQPQGISPFQWSLNGQALDSLTRLDGLSGGTYELAVEDAIGCRAEDQFFIDTLPRLQANLFPSLELNMGESYALNLETNRDPADIAQVRWSPDSFVSCQDCLDPILQQPTRSQIYEVQIRDTFGCEVRLPLALRVVRQDRVFLPTAFSPNGDGINDELRVFFGPEVGQLLHFQVYSRWGLLVSSQIQPPLISPLSWDGTSDRGQAVPEGVYLVVLRYAYLDGLVRTVSGSVTVIR